MCFNAFSLSLTHTASSIESKGLRYSSSYFVGSFFVSQVLGDLIIIIICLLEIYLFLSRSIGIIIINFNFLE